MQKIVYYVASSIDGFIAGENEDISKFVTEGKMVETYLRDLSKYETVIMGRKTYEFGYRFGLEPGQPAYPHMKHYIFSESLKFKSHHELVKICKLNLEMIKKIKENSETDIYLCGGGRLAGWLLTHNLIDQLKIKLNPIILGTGTPIFNFKSSEQRWKLSATESYDQQSALLTYDLIN